jgi:hypothetical protein
MTQNAYLEHLNDVLATRRKRNEKIKKAIIATLITASVLTLPVSVAIRDHARLTEWEATREVRLIRVMPGDSVDGYWAEYSPSWMNREDYREQFKELNNLDSCYLYEGDFVKVYTTAD